MNLERLEAQLTQLPLFAYFFTDPKDLEFSPRIRWICENECPRYGKSWACQPAVGSVEECAAKCKGYDSCLAIGTVTEVADIANMDQCLATRFDHEALTEEVAGFLKEQGVNVLICGGIGGGAQMALADAGISLFGGVSGDADEAVEALLAGQLAYNPNVRCNHHDHGHDHGHHHN